MSIQLSNTKCTFELASRLTSGTPGGYLEGRIVLPDTYLSGGLDITLSCLANRANDLNPHCVHPCYPHLVYKDAWNRRDHREPQPHRRNWLRRLSVKQGEVLDVLTNIVVAKVEMVDGRHVIQLGKKKNWLKIVIVKPLTKNKKDNEKMCVVRTILHDLGVVPSDKEVEGIDNFFTENNYFNLHQAKLKVEFSTNMNIVGIAESSLIEALARCQSRKKKKNIREVNRDVQIHLSDNMNETLKNKAEENMIDAKLCESSPTDVKSWEINNSIEYFNNNGEFMDIDIIMEDFDIDSILESIIPLEAGSPSPPGRELHVFSLLEVLETNHFIDRNFGRILNSVLLTVPDAHSKSGQLFDSYAPTTSMTPRTLAPDQLVLHRFGGRIYDLAALVSQVRRGEYMTHLLDIPGEVQEAEVEKEYNKTMLSRSLASLINRELVVNYVLLTAVGGPILWRVCHPSVFQPNSVKDMNSRCISALVQVDTNMEVDENAFMMLVRQLEEDCPDFGLPQQVWSYQEVNSGCGINGMVSNMNRLRDLYRNSKRKHDMHSFH